MLTIASGHPCPLRFLHNLINLGPSRWQRLLRWLRRRGHPHLRHSSKACTSHGPMLAETQAVDNQRTYATRRLQRVDQRVEEWRGEAVGYPER